METRAHYVAIGAFVLTMVFLGFVAVLYFGSMQLTTHFTRYDIYFKGPVTGLSKGAVVEYNGIPVGRVFSLEIDPNNVERIRVTVEIDDKVVIKSDVEANVETNLLSGVSSILLAKGTQGASPLVAKPGQRYPVIASRRSTLATISARGPALLDQLSHIGDHLDEMMNKRNREAFAQILENIREITGTLAARDKDISKIAVNTDAALVSLTKVLDDVDHSYMEPGGVKDRLTRSLASLDKAAAGVDKASRAIGQVADETRVSVHDVNTQTLVALDALLRETRVLVAGLTRFESEIARDPSRLLLGDRHQGYHPP